MILPRSLQEFEIEGPLASIINTFLKVFALLLNFYLLPLAGYWFYQDNLILVSSMLLSLLTFNIFAYYSLQHRPSPIAQPLIIFTLGLTLVLSVYYVGDQPILWTYPILVAVYFVIPLRLANICNILIVLPITALLFTNYELSLTLRYLGSVFATLALGNVIVFTINSLHQQLLTHAITDPLTGAYNRRQMDLTLDQQILQNSREQVTSSILMLDIDFFKKINDQHGHEAGDLVLQQLVAKLFSRLRKSDMVFRVGGEEFLVLLHQTTGTQAAIIAESLRQALAEISVNNGEQSITVSFGVAQLTAHMNKQSWLKVADSCLYRAKSQGRNKVIAAYIPK